MSQSWKHLKVASRVGEEVYCAAQATTATR